MEAQVLIVLATLVTGYFSDEVFGPASTTVSSSPDSRLDYGVRISQERQAAGYSPTGYYELLNALNLRSPDFDLLYCSNSSATSNTTMVKFIQTLKGVPIYGTVVTALFDAYGQLLTGEWLGKVYNDSTLDSPIPTVTPRAALKRLAMFLKLCQYLSVARNINTKLIWYRSSSNSTMQLAYQVSFFLDVINDQPPTRPFGIIDAVTGAVIETWEGLTTQRPSVTLTGVGGNEQTGLIQSPLLVQSQGQFTCQYSSAFVQVQNMQVDKAPLGKSVRPSSFPCSQSQNRSFDFANGGFGPSNDIMINAEIVVKMFNDYVQYSLTANAALQAVSHYGENYNNCLWDGAFALFGDGDASSTFPFTTLDWVGHEYGHFYTEINSLLRTTGESGGINEAFSDMAGQAAVFHSNGTNNFLPGKLASKNGRPIRNMCQPEMDGFSVSNYSAYLNIVDTNSKYDIHFASGVYNKAFCNLAKMPGWNTATAFKVFAIANRLAWQEQTTFNQGVCGVIAAANSKGLECADVINTFQSVGLSCDRSGYEDGNGTLLHCHGMI